MFSHKLAQLIKLFFFSNKHVHLLKLFSLILFFNAFVYADIQSDLNVLKPLGRDMEPTGTICEEIARLRFSEKYPEPDFSVVTGIQYSDKFGNTIGELDLVVFNNKTQVAQLIGEVKCYTSPKNGLKKAKEQRKRFLDNVHSPKALQFKWYFDKNRKLTKTQFNKTNQFITIAQKGTLDHGYDVELNYTLKELMQMRAEILNCQAVLQCPRIK